MSNPFFDHPTLNSPKKSPPRHWEHDGQGQATQQIIDKLRIRGGTPSMEAIGRFVESSANNLGIGKLSQTDGKNAIVEYFESPANADRVQCTVEVKSLRLVRLEPEVRVYFEDPESLHWCVGRILHFQQEDGKYLVRFPNNERRLIEESALFTRWAKPIDDPTDHLALHLNETPFWHDGRSAFIHNVYSQRNACGGMSGLLSSSIELVEHQVSVVRRVLRDPFQRYLLADEVGLGKTIEAGVLIRQHVLDAPEAHCVLVIVPESLIQQWKEELICRFHLECQLGNSIHVIGHHDAATIEQLGSNSTLVVIDEAHHLSAWAYSNEAELLERYQVVERIAVVPERGVLLLSATPVLHNEQAFLAMLHLIDPVLYSLDDLDAFRSRVRHRQEVAEAMISLTEGELNLFLGQTLERLSELFPNDERFHQLKKPLEELIGQEVPEEDAERRRLIRALRTHVSEMWRLHRRLLRNRRDENTKFLLPGRRGVELVRWESSEQRILEEILSEWRLSAAEAAMAAECTGTDLQQLARLLTEAAICDPDVLIQMIEHRLSDLSGSIDHLCLFDTERRCLEATPNFEGEVQCLRQLQHAAKRCRYERRFLAVEDMVRKIDANSSNQPTPIVVFANYPLTADCLCEFLKKRLGAQRVLRHSSIGSHWMRFIRATESLVLICDRRAEEGLNLQNRNAVVIHFDLPLSANRIEQRMGRLDRFGTGRPITSFVLVTSDLGIQFEWLRCLDEALGVFDRSIASLQYLIESQFQRVWEDFLDAGADAITEATLRLRGTDGEIEKEFRRIRVQDELDALEQTSVEDTAFFDSLSNCDLKTSDFRRSFNQWVVDRLHFRCSGENGRGDDVVRYQFCRRDDLRPRRGERDTLMPYSDLMRRFHAALDEPTELRPPAVAETKSMAFDRQTAQRREVRLARIGDSLIDAIEQHLRWDDRGICYALWRYRPSLSIDRPAELAFRFDLIIEADVSPLRDLANAWPEVNLAALRRRAEMAFAPIVGQLWLDSELERITDPVRLRILNERYRDEPVRGGTQGDKDFNINQDRWQKVNQLFDITVWRGLCYAAREKAELILREQSKLSEMVHNRSERAASTCSHRVEQFESRLARIYGDEALSLHHELEFERAFSIALQKSIRYPAIKVDSMGAVFLSSHNPFAEEVAPEDED